MSKWNVESLRLTGFTPATWPESAEDLWTAVVGVPAEQINQRPRESAAKVEGLFEDARLVIAREPRRTDFVWIVERQISTPFKEYPSIGDFQTASKLFLSLAKTWLKRSSPLNRIAWGGVLVLPAANKEDGYRKVNGFLPNFKIDPVGSFDFNYQINRPRTSKTVAGLRINRLCKWSVASAARVMLVATQNPMEPIEASADPRFSACRLEFDINSDGEHKDALPNDQVVPLLDEFVKLAEEIADRGDVP